LGYLEWQNLGKYRDLKIGIYEMPKFEHNLITAWGVGRVGNQERERSIQVKEKHYENIGEDFEQVHES
jgi:hypothetical protein